MLLSVVKEARVARALGKSPEAIRELRLTRRTVLAGALGGAAMTACGGTTRDSEELFQTAEPIKTDKRVAIVGGGIAGLNCALGLKDAGVQATVYESSGRLGGRMFSNTSGYWANGQTTEWFGELIDTGHLTLQRLARRFNLPLEELLAAEPEGSEDTLYFDGQYYPREDAVRDFFAIEPLVQADLKAAGYPTSWNRSTAAGRELDNMSIPEWIDSRVPGGRSSMFGQFLDVSYLTEYGAETEDQSALNLLYLLAYQPGPKDFLIFGVSDERFHVKGGNQQIPLAIANALGPQAVKLGMRLESIRQRSDGTQRLTFQDHGKLTTVDADIVVLSLPFAVLRNLDHGQAGFDDRKLAVIREMGTARNNKLQLQFNTRHWNQTGPWPAISNGGSFSDQGYQCMWEATRGQPGQSGILVQYGGGNTTLAMLTKQALATASNSQVRADANRFLSQVEPVLPGVSAQWNGLATQSLPHLLPDLLLSYSYWRVGQYQLFGDYGALPSGNVFFAGEHTSTDFQGYMEGGATEGARAAQEVLAALKGVGQQAA
jgi:monoamine oxidase